jgi:acetyl-CoA carboxylase biotin carboxyl carrier protein
MAKLAAKSEVSGSVCKIEVVLGQKVAEGDTLVLIESMKMEIPVIAEKAGIVASLLVAEGDVIIEGQSVLTLET